MTYFEPPPLPGAGSGREPVDPYARPSSDPYATAPTSPATAPTDPAPATAPGGPSPAPTLGWGPPATYTHPRGTLVLVLGILSVTVMQILGPLAWVMGHRTLREIDASGLPHANRSSVQIGMVLGIIGTILGVIGILWAIPFVIMMSGRGMM